MREANYGRIIQTSSGTGLFGNFGQANYGAAKMGLIGMMHVLAIEGARNNIAINAIAPIARTRMTEDIMGEAGKGMDPELVTPVTPGSPLITVSWHEKLNQILTGSANGETHVLYNPNMVPV